MVFQFALLRGFDIAVPLFDALAMLPVVFLVAVLPISVQGLGTTQTMMVYFFARYAQGDPAAREAAVIAASLVGQAVAFGFQAAARASSASRAASAARCKRRRRTDRGDARGSRRHRPRQLTAAACEPRRLCSARQSRPRRRLIAASSSLRAKLIISTTSALPRAAVSSSSPPRVARAGELAVLADDLLERAQHVARRDDRRAVAGVQQPAPPALRLEHAAVAERQRRLLEGAPVAPGQHARDLLRHVVELLLGQDAPPVVGVDRPDARHDEQAPDPCLGSARCRASPRAGARAGGRSASTRPAAAATAGSPAPAARAAGQPRSRRASRPSAPCRRRRRPRRPAAFRPA